MLENVVDGKSIVVGDINIDVISTSDPNTMQYVEVMCSYGFVIEINIPTYVSPVTGTETSCLDHIWHNLCSTCSSGVIRPALPDHYPVYCAFDVEIKTNPIKINFRDFSMANIRQFKNVVEEVFNNFLCKLFCKLLNKYFLVNAKVKGGKRLNIVHGC